MLFPGLTLRLKQMNRKTKSLQIQEQTLLSVARELHPQICPQHSDPADGREVTIQISHSEYLSFFPSLFLCWWNHLVMVSSEGTSEHPITCFFYQCISVSIAISSLKSHALAHSSDSNKPSALHYVQKFSFSACLAESHMCYSSAILAVQCLLYIPRQDIHCIHP